MPAGYSSHTANVCPAVGARACAFQERTALPRGVLWETWRKSVATVSLGTEVSGGMLLETVVM